MDLRERVIAIVAEQALLDPADVREDMTLADLGIDSLGVVETIFAIEEAFDVSVPFNANDPEAGDFDISTVGHVIAGVVRLVAERG
jgi:acyl carrier protein